MKRRIPYGVGSYEKIVDQDFYYVDKTPYIRALERVENPVFLRPRRFGKTLWCSTLECYYDVNRKDRFDHLFGRTAIGRDPTPRHSSMLVLRFNFSLMSVGDTVAELQTYFDLCVGRSVKSFANAYAAYADFSPATALPHAAEMLDELRRIVRDGGTPPIYLIIDEYDNFTNQLITSHRDADYYAVTGRDSFLKNFYKTIKGGVEDQSIGGLFITGVLPVTVDDLTSGFNIARVIGLEQEFVSMLGFTHSEADAYLDEICAGNGWNADLKNRVLRELKDNYDSYRFTPDAAEPVYNATACNFYLDSLVRHDGALPRETVDDNLRTDVNWLRRLVGTSPASRAAFDELVQTGSVFFSEGEMSSRFNASQFFAPERFLTALYYLGLVTYGDNRFDLRVPNATVKNILYGYYRQLAGMDFSAQSDQRTIALAVLSFYETEDWAALWDAFARVCLAKVPAQAYDQANENFFRTMFYVQCSSYLEGHFRLAIESNLPHGRADFIAAPDPKSTHRTAVVVEFKYYKNAEAERRGVLSWTEPPAEARAQAVRYAADVKAIYPDYDVAAHVVCIAGSKGARFW